MGRPRDNAIRTTKSIEMSMDGMMTGDSSRWTFTVSLVLYTILYSISFWLSILVLPSPSPAPRTIFPRIMVIHREKCLRIADQNDGIW